jgi:hypothetical protein
MQIQMHLICEICVIFVAFLQVQIATFSIARSLCRGSTALAEVCRSVGMTTSALQCKTQE